MSESIVSRGTRLAQLLSGRGSGVDPKKKSLLSNSALLDLFEIFVEEVQQQQLNAAGRKVNGIDFKFWKRSMDLGFVHDSMAHACTRTLTLAYERLKIIEIKYLVDFLLAQLEDASLSDFVLRSRPALRQIQSLRPSLADFDVVRTIGRGHFGQVKVVKEKSSDEVFAMKILKKSEMKSQKTVAFFEEERDILAAGRLIYSLYYCSNDNLGDFRLPDSFPFRKKKKLIDS